jgi:pimeloyl-ACP methyl ester carboxylesterase
MRVTSRSLASREVQRPDDTTIRYTISGPADGPTLVFIHGWCCNRTDFDEVTGFLPAGYRVLAVGLAEHGESRSARGTWTIEEFARDVAAVLTAESVESCVVAGHSLGAAVAIELARLLPSVVTHVVSLDGLHYLSLYPPQDEQRAGALLRPFHEDFPKALLALVGDTYFEKLVAVRQPAGLYTLEGLVHWDMDAALTEIKQPVTVFAVRGLIAPEAIDRYGDRMRIELVDLGSHFFLVESPEGTAEVLARLMSEEA